MQRQANQSFQFNQSINIRQSNQYGQINEISREKQYGTMNLYDSQYGAEQ
ncbi:hypothetical protein KFK09_009844 [Dendrobium nobile]|uniref:Uncharacterized protein n=1 Tax=Dendrobium nobile TaxID=94219 RepID=A0A8T3BIJ9_DENNO|nr:hypothetical protein KFK09_009844 [Dendrobium nobile]